MTVVSIDSQARSLPVFKGAAMCNPGFRRVCASVAFRASEAALRYGVL